MIKHHIRAALTALMISIAAAHTLAAQGSSEPSPLELDGSSRQASLSGHVEHISDPRGKLNLNAVLRDTTLVWHPNFDHHHGVWSDSGNYWVRFALRNTDTVAHPFMLELEQPVIGSATLYRVVDGKAIPLFENAGLQHPFNDRKIPHRNLLAQLTLDKDDEAHYLIHIRSDHLFQFRATVWNELAFFKRDQNRQLLYGLIYGIIIVLTLYNAFLYISTRDRSFYHFTLLLVSSLYFMAAIEGHVYEYIAPSHAWPKLPVMAIAVTVTYIMLSRFIIGFLDLRHHAPVLRKAIHIFSLVSAVLTLITLVINESLIVLILVAFVLALYICVLIAAFRRRVAGFVPAGYIVLGIVLQMFSLILAMTAISGVLQLSALVESIPAIGTMLMLTLFALALSDRINSMQLENHRASDLIGKLKHDTRSASAALAKSQQELRTLESLNEHRRKDSTRRAFFAGIGEDIFAPVNALMTSVQLLATTQLSNWQFKLISQIQREGKSLLNIGEDYQQRADIGGEEISPQYQRITLETFIDDCVATHAYLVKPRGILIFSHMDTGVPPFIRSDPRKLRHLIINFLRNSIRYTEKGYVVLHVEPVNRESVNSIELKFTITNTGRYVSQEELDLIRRGMETDDKNLPLTNQRRQLQLFRQVIEALNGTYGLTRDEGIRSSFWFTARALKEENNDLPVELWPAEIQEKSVALLGTPDLLRDEIHRRLHNQKLLPTIFDNTEALHHAKADGMTFDLVVFVDDAQLDTETIRQQLDLSSENRLLIVASNALQRPEDTLLEPRNTEILDLPITGKQICNALLQLLAPKVIENLHQRLLLLERDTDSLALLTGIEPTGRTMLSTLLTQLGMRFAYLTDNNQLPAYCRDHQPTYVFYGADIDFPEVTISPDEAPIPFIAIISGNGSDATVKEGHFKLTLPTTAASMKELFAEIEKLRSIGFE